MWFIQWHRLILCLGICLFFMGAFLETVEAKRAMGINQRKGGKGKLMVASNRGEKNRKSSKKQKQPKKQNSSKNQTGSDTKISVYNCPSEAVQMNCLSCTAKVYRKCPIAAANKITKVQVMKEYTDSYGKCNVGRKENFGILDDSSIWVNYGCRAKFLICYEKGRHEPKTVNCMYTESKHKCPTGLHGLRINIDIKISLLWSFGAGKCKEGDTWGYANDDIWVDRGCSGTFRVLW